MAKERKAKKGAGQGVRPNPFAISSFTPPYLRFSDDEGVCGGQYVFPVNIHKWPSKLRIGWGQRLASKSLKAPITLVVQKADEAAIDRELNRVLSYAEPQPGDGLRSYTDLARKQKQGEDARQIIEMMLDDNESQFNVTPYLLLRADDKDELRRRFHAAGEVVRNATKARFDRQFSNLRSAFFGASPAICDDPAARDRYAVPMPALTIAMGEFFTTNGFDDGYGVPLGVDDDNGIIRVASVVHSDEKQNGNVALIGGSGSGKSTVMKHWALMEHLLFGARVIQANDVEAEFRTLALAVGGEVTDPVGKLSPFEPRNIAATSDAGEDWETERYVQEALSSRVLESTIPFLKTYLRTAYPVLADDDRGLSDYLGDPLTAIYAKYGITPETTFSEYYEGPQRFPMLVDLYDELLAEAAGAPNAATKSALERIALAIKDQAVGYAAAQWNTQERFELHSKFCVIDTSHLSEDKNLRRAQLYNILMWVWGQTTGNRFGSEYTRICFDELGSIYDGKEIDLKLQVSEIVRRARKYNAGVMFAFQGINEVIQGDDDTRKLGTTMLNNCCYKLFGRSEGTNKDANLRQVQDYLNLTDQARNRLGMIERPNFLIAISKNKNWLSATAVKDWELEMFGRGGGR